MFLRMCVSVQQTEAQQGQFILSPSLTCNSAQHHNHVYVCLCPCRSLCARFSPLDLAAHYKFQTGVTTKLCQRLFICCLPLSVCVCVCSACTCKSLTSKNSFLFFLLGLHFEHGYTILSMQMEISEIHLGNLQ